VGSSSNVRE